MFVKRCIVCQKEFTTLYNHQKYCSQDCRIQYLGRTTSFSHLPTGTVGAIGELIVATDLLKKGYEVYRSLSPSCSADLLAEKEQKILKIEVRTGYVSGDGKLAYTPYNVHAPILAIVVHSENKIYYLEHPSGKEVDL